MTVLTGIGLLDLAKHAGHSNGAEICLTIGGEPKRWVAVIGNIGNATDACPPSRAYARLCLE
jgi:hypothetical protein